VWLQLQQRLLLLLGSAAAVLAVAVPIMDQLLFEACLNELL